MPPSRQGSSLPLRLKIGPKFSLLLLVLVASVLAVTWGGFRGLREMKSGLDRIYDHNLREGEPTRDLERSLAEAAVAALQLVATKDTAHHEQLRAQLDVRIIPAVAQSIDAVTSGDVGDPEVVEDFERIEDGWRDFLVLYRSGQLEATPPDASVVRLDERLAQRLTAVFQPMSRAAADITADQVAEGREADQFARQAYRDALVLMFALGIVTLLLGVLSVSALIRSVVTRVREYSAFAGDVAAGRLKSHLRLRGNDELTELGAALNEMVKRREAENDAEARQEEFVDTLQVTGTEEEAHELLRRHVERSIPASSAVVLNRNNSADRLEATTELVAGSGLAERLIGAEPRSCLAVRFARCHGEDPNTAPLVKCELCGREDRFSTCEPLLVGGEVIGSVLVEHTAPLTDEHQVLIRSSVSQAAPVLANLRNLALAEFRAATDGLTGLPNSRAVRETLKRMVAHASRSVTPLAVALLDLDHFKQINDTLGHGLGDDALAAAGDALRSALRESDFVGRFGGEEFLILLPGTHREGALTVAEKVRAAIEKVAVKGIDRPITASIGVAIFPDDAPDGETLLRHADRALYTAKANGRNRVEASVPPGSDQEREISAVEVEA